MGVAVRFKGALLILDHDEEIRSLHAEMLLAEGYDVRIAPTCEEALSFLMKGWLPSLILLNLRMPNGDQFFDTLRASRQYERVPVIVTSGYAQGFPWVARVDPPVSIDTLLSEVAKYVR